MVHGLGIGPGWETKEPPEIKLTPLPKCTGQLVTCICYRAPHHPLPSAANAANTVVATAVGGGGHVCGAGVKL